VAGLAGGRLSNEDYFQFQKLFRDGLSSNNLDLARRRLAGGEVVATVGISSDSNLLDLGEGDAVLVVASDLHEEAPIWWFRLKQAAERGAKLVVLNLRPTRLDKFASHVIHYPLGEALATVRQLVNLAKVDTDTAESNPLAAAADALITANNLVAFYGSEGLTYEQTGTLARLLANLLLIENDEGESHAGRDNNGLIPVWPDNNTQGAWDMGIHPTLGPGYVSLAEPGLDAAAIYEGAADGSLQALFIAGADPVGDGLMIGRGQLSFLVVQELFMTETAAQADVVLPAQSWAEREGTFTSGERRVQRYYPAIPVVGQSRADWQILAQIGERVGLGKPAFAASLAFRDLAQAVGPYKGLDYRSLAWTEKQWPDVGGEDMYYGGNAYDNRSGLGQRWASAVEQGEVEPFDIPALDDTIPTDLHVVHTAALYTPGTLIDQSTVLAPRVARPTLYLHRADAADQGVADGEPVMVRIVERQVEATVHVNGHAPQGTALLRGVRDGAGGTAVIQISKIEVREEEPV
jgi:NADH-quinone oxidoreductase subunit G